MALEIKGIMLRAVQVNLDPTISFEENYTELKEKVDSSFFDDSKVLINKNELDISDDEQKMLETLLLEHNANILGYRAPQQLQEENKKKNSVNGEHKNNLQSGELFERKRLKTVKGTLRGGQNLEYDGDVLIIGSVNPDAYVKASGNIIVTGTLRGVAHAGFMGDETTVVIAMKLKPQQLRIAGYVTRSPDDDVLNEYPEKAFVKNNTIYIEKI